MTNKKYIVREPQQSKLGGWLCQVLDGQDIVYETFQISKKLAFQEAVLWLYDMSDGKLQKVDHPEQKDENAQPG